MSAANRYRAAGLALLACALLTRFADLGTRFFTHDEAIHATFAAQLAGGSGYHYDPVYHGPLLYHLEAAVFRVFGEGDYQARVPAAAFGVLLVMLLFRVLAPRLGLTVAAVAATLALLSPSLSYYARFNSHDSLIAALTVVMIAGALEGTPAGMLWCAGALGLAIATKLNAYFIVAGLAAYFVCFSVYRRTRELPIAPSLPRASLPTAVAATLLLSAIVALLSVSTTMFYVSAGQRLPAATVTAARSMLFGGFVYWQEAHRTARLGGPFHFYLPILAIYEPLVLIAAVAAIAHFMHRRWTCLLTLAIVLSAGWVVMSYTGLALAAGLERWHVLLALTLLVTGGWAVVSLWADERNLLAGWLFLGVVQFLLYSYANEKVPWLAVHIVVPWLVVVASYLVDLWQSSGSRFTRMAFIAGVLLLEVLSARGAWIVNTTNRSNVAEPLLHMQYADSVRDTVQLVRQQAMLSNSTSPVVTIEPWVQWPLAWYIRQVPLAYPPGRLEPDVSSPVVVAADGAVDVHVEGRYTLKKLGYYQSSFWIDNVNRGDLGGLLRFMLFHDRWGREQTSLFIVGVRRDLAATAGF